jgi:putative DNA primase/helicase
VSRLTDAGNAERLIARHGQDLRYCAVWQKWLAWDEKRWRPDAEGEANLRAQETARNFYQLAAETTDAIERSALAKHAVRSESAERIAAMLKIGRWNRSIQVSPDDLDKNPWLLNCVNGMVDLRTGELLAHDRDCLITKLCPTPYQPDADCPTWLAFLNKIHADNGDIIGYLRRVWGYCLTADVSEQVLPTFWGTGSNGKSTEVNTILEMLGGDFAIKAAPEIVMLKADAHPCERADLFGMRVVSCIESTEGRRLNETLVKELTGGDPIRARRMRENFWQFMPTHKLVIATNYKPTIRGQDYAIWRRVKLVPFTVTISDEERDKRLPDKLRAELPGILAWCVRGCLEWQRAGNLGEPDEVRLATAEYKQEEDVLGQFIEACCDTGDGLMATAADLLKAYQEWSGDKRMSAKTLGIKLGRRFKDKRGARGVHLWQGIGLRLTSDERCDV